MMRAMWSSKAQGARNNGNSSQFPSVFNEYLSKTSDSFEQSYDSDDERLDASSHHGMSFLGDMGTEFEDTRRVRSQHDQVALGLAMRELRTGSVDQISREQQFLVRQTVQQQQQQASYMRQPPAPRPQWDQPTTQSQHQPHLLQQAFYHQQQPSNHPVGNPTAAAPPMQQQHMTNPRQYLADTFETYESPFKQRFGSLQGGSGVPSMPHGGPKPPMVPIMNNNGGQYSNFVERIPAMLHGEQGGATSDPYGSAMGAGGAAAYAQQQVSPYDASGAFRGNHQLAQQSRGGITSAGGNILSLGRGRGGNLLIGSNQGRGVYSEKSSANLIMAGLYEGSGTVYVVQLKCQYRHYVADPGAPQGLEVGDFVIVDADRGEDLGIIIELLPMQSFVDRQRSMHISLEDEQNEVGRILREAALHEREQLPSKYQDELMVIELCKTLAVNTYQMQMIVVDAEYQFDRHKLTVYYDSAVRIDFRELVRDLFAAFKTRIWFKKANNRYFKAKQYALVALATGGSDMRGGAGGVGVGGYQQHV